MDKKKQYIFPMNYKRKEKFLGIIDYKTLTFLIAFLSLVWGIINRLIIPLTWKIVLVICITGVPVIFIMVGIGGENMLDFIYFMLKYCVKDKIYVYKKVYEEGFFEKVYKKLVSNKRDRRWGY